MNRSVASVVEDVQPYRSSQKLAHDNRYRLSILKRLPSSQNCRRRSIAPNQPPQRVVLLLAFVIAYSFKFTGLSVHEWFGLAFGLALLVHLTLHWDWVLRTTRRILSASGRRRVMWAVNFLVLLD